MSSEKQQIIYGVNDSMPVLPFILTSVQHMLMLISVALALPVAVSDSAGLDVAHSGALLAATLFGMGIVTIFQSINGKFIGSGYQSFSTSDSAAIACCVMAAELGGVPLVLGMSIFAGVLKFILGNFAYPMRKLFSPEATGALIFVVGINLVPTAFKYFLGTTDVSRPEHILVASLTFLFMIACTIFIKRLKPYVALVGIAFGYILSLIFGVFDTESFYALKDSAIVTLPFYTEWEFSFDISMLLPFAIITLASVVDNIGDFSASQMAAEPGKQKPDWRSITKGIRGGGLGCTLVAVLGSPLQSTATANIGVARATGIVSRRVAFLGAAILMAITFFPQVMGLMAIIPQPVLGAVIMYSMCYIMAGGFLTLQQREIDDRKTLTIFLTIAAAISTLIPGLYSFLPESVQSILISPMVLGTCVLVVLSVICKIGNKKRYEFTTGTDAGSIEALEDDIKEICGKWGTQRYLCRKLQISIAALCEALYHLDSNSKLSFIIAYDELCIKVKMTVSGSEISRETVNNNKKDDDHILAVTFKMLENMFEDIRIENKNGALLIELAEDI